MTSTTVQLSPDKVPWADAETVVGDVFSALMIQNATHA